MAFTVKFFAHRGLHSTDVPENSRAALLEAKRAGFGSELDINLDGDDNLIVFHDDRFKRMTGLDKTVWDTPESEVRALRLSGTEEPVPYFEELAGELAPMPLIVELKHTARRETLCRKAAEIIRAYKGEAVMESFDPKIVRWFYKNAPDIKRGLLLSPPGKHHTFFRRLFLKSRFIIAYTKPHFVAVSKGLEQTGRIKRAVDSGIDLVIWTVREPFDHTADGIIFEGFLPDRGA